MKMLLTKFALWHRNPRFAQSGFGIIEALVVLLLIAGAAAGLGQFFLSSKDMVLNQRARLAFEEDLLRLMMITEENSVCEHLNLVSSGFKLLNTGSSNLRIGEIPKLEFDNVVMAKVGKDRRYGIKSIELFQLSVEYGKNPRRARGSIVIVPEFYEKDGITVKKGSELPEKGNIDVIIAADPGGLINSCYGTFSRKISCLDGNGIFEPERTPNCQFR
ncbi:MAG: type II secretion system protein [Oligoflexus sp.]|nr:type II secretion system protein [Oligoflexus sp.]